eukprot:Hpha_TRINITY_DN12540_c0_g1::TRINITY_DN12540_c0_g1_i1::g.50778::m.50778
MSFFSYPASSGTTPHGEGGGWFGGVAEAPPRCPPCPVRSSNTENVASHRKKKNCFFPIIRPPAMFLKNRVENGNAVFLFLHCSCSFLFSPSSAPPPRHPGRRGSKGWGLLGQANVNIENEIPTQLTYRKTLFTHTNLVQVLPLPQDFPAYRQPCNHPFLSPPSSQASNPDSSQERKIKRKNQEPHKRKTVKKTNKRELTEGHKRRRNNNDSPLVQQKGN